MRYYSETLSSVMVFIFTVFKYLVTRRVTLTFNWGYTANFADKLRYFLALFWLVVGLETLTQNELFYVFNFAEKAMRLIVCQAK